MTAAERLYRKLMRVLPKGFRRRFGPEMIAMLSDRRSELTPTRLAATSFFWCHEYADLFVTAFREWTRTDQDPRGATMSSQSPSGNTNQPSFGNGMFADIRLAVRNMLRHPGFSLIVVATLGLGIGANTAMFGIVDAVILRPLPYDHADRIVKMTGLDTRTGQTTPTLPYADYLIYNDQATSFESIEGFDGTSYILSGAEREPTRIATAAVTNGLFDLLRVSPMLGRSFSPDEHIDDPNIVILNHGFWITEFGANPDIIGASIRLDAEPHTVIGVMPPGFDYPYLGEMGGWMPLQSQEFDGVDTTTAFSERDWHQISIVARLGDATAADRAAVEVQTIADRLAQSYPRSNANLTVQLDPLKSAIVGNLRRPLLLTLAAVACVLIIACVNIANLLLARGMARSGEVAVRGALGASRWRIVRQFLLESLSYATLGGFAGVGLAYLLLRLARSFEFQGPRMQTINLDGRILLVVAATTIITGLFFGILPAWRASNPDLQSALKAGRGTTVQPSRSRLLKTLVAAEMALSTVLVIGAGLLVASFARLTTVDPGFEPENVLTMRLSLPGRKYMQNPDDPWQGSTAFFRELTSRVKQLPGVNSVALSFTNPLEPQRAFNTRFNVPGVLDVPRAEQPFANLRTVTPPFFETFRIPLRSGRLFTDRDVKTSPGVAVVNETLARQIFERADPIGHRIEGPNFWGQAGYPQNWEIVGVVGDVRSAGLSRPPRPAMYFPFDQTPMGNMRLIVRTDGNPIQLAPAVREQVWGLDPDLPVDNLYTMERILADNVAIPRLAMITVGAFALLALALAALGVYGVMSYAVGQRTSEFGIRQALGADKGKIVAMVLRQGMTVVGIGVALGLLAALGVGRAMASYLYGVTVTDPLTFAIVTTTLIVVAGYACYIPAKRATRIDPVRALNTE